MQERLLLKSQQQPLCMVVQWCCSVDDIYEHQLLVKELHKFFIWFNLDKVCVL